MRGEAMEKIVSTLINKKIPLHEYTALEFFARDGSWQTTSYNKKIKNLYLWEIDETYKNSLKKNFPKAKISIGDSFELSQKEKFKNKFNFIVFDNPLCVYNEYCEHFEALDLTYLLLDNKGIVIFNINKCPFDYEEKHNLEWKKRRDDYYGFNTMKIDSKTIMNFYEKKFNDYGFKILFNFEEKRNNEYFSYLVFMLEK